MCSNYLGNATKVLICPSTHDDPSRRTLGIFYWFRGYADMPTRVFEGTNLVRFTSYSINGWLTELPPWPWEEGLFFKNEGDVAQPSKTPIFSDSQAPSNYPRTNSPPSRDLYFSSYPGVDSMSFLTIARHGSGGTAHNSKPVTPDTNLGAWFDNVGCFDGHVDRVKLNNLWQYYWNKGWVVPPSIPK